ncbi:MAG: glycosyltransferase family 39 protein [Candidatus Omnitrophota bacterium]
MKKEINLSPYIIIVLLIVVVFVIILRLIPYERFAENPDENYYLKYAVRVADNGLFEFRSFFREYLGDRNNWTFPNPLRIGFILLSAIFCKIFGNSFFSLTYLALFSYLVFIIINYYFCSKIFDREKAVLLALLIAFSPLNMAMAKRALSDSTTTLFFGLSIWTFLNLLLSEDKTIAKKILFLLSFSFAVLVKETCVFLMVPFFIFTIIYKSKVKEKLNFSSTLLYIFIYPAISVTLVYLLAAGDLSKIWEISEVVSSTVKINVYAILFGSGPWFRYIIDYMLLSCLTTILALGYLFYLLKDMKKNDIRETYFFIVLLALFVSYNFFTKNIRYVIVFDLPIRLFSILMLYRLIPERIKPNLKLIILGTAVSLICITDIISFKKLFVLSGIYDPVTFLLLKSREMIPWL